MTLASELLPVGTLVLGYLGTLFTESRRDAREWHREELARSSARKQQLLDRRESFEIDHLVRLNEALNDLARASGRLHHLDSMIAKQSGSYASHQIGDEETSQAMLAANRSVHTLTGLVLNDGLRELVREAHRACNEPSSLRNATQEEAETVFHRAVSKLETAQDGIAVRVRDLYQRGALDAEPAAPS